MCQARIFLMEKTSGFCRENGIYYSKREPAILPESPYTSVTSYVFSQNRDDSWALVDYESGITLNFAAMQSNARAVARGLQRFGVQKGEVVMVLSHNSILLPSIYFGIFSAGAILTACNPLLTPHEIQSQIKLSNPVLIFVTSNLVEKILPTKIPVILIDGGHSHKVTKVIRCVSTLRTLLEAEYDHSGCEKVPVDMDDSAAILYSSGTTGKTKGVVLSHRNMIAATAVQLGRHDELKSDKMHAFFMPLYHIYGLTHFVFCAAQGHGVVLMHRFDVREMVTCIQRYRINVIPAAPPLILSLLKSELVSGGNLSSLSLVLSGGAPLGRESIEEFCARFPHVEVGQGYGLTETCGPVAFTKSPEGKGHFGSVGLLVSNVEAKIVDVITGKCLPPNHKGELWVRGPSIMKCYLRDEEATTLTLDNNGWLKTGDLCYFDEDGFLFVVDRLKEMIKYKAYQVAPAELEELLLSHRDILDAAVIPYPDKEAGQIPMACIVRKPKSNLCEADVISFVKSKVAPYKRIRRVIFISSIPKSSSGKILRKDLKHLTLVNSSL